jgi:LmbE family N-acetylglucosaminyl deacetylase
MYAFEADFDTLAAQLRAHIESLALTVVLTHGADGEYGHPAHILVHKAVRAAISSLPNPPLLYTFAARVPAMEDHLWNQNEPAHLALDIRPWLDTKEAAMRCHRSQHALFLRKKQGQTLREAARKVEAYHRHLPPVEAGEQPHDPFADLLRAAGAWAPSHTDDA